MRVTIVGSKERSSTQDKEMVEQLIDMVSDSTFDVRFVCTDSWQIGVGQFVRTKCTEKVRGEFKHQVIIYDVRTYTSHLTKQEIADIYLARNAALFKISDVLYFFSGSDRRGTIEDLVDQMVAAGRPVKVFMPGDKLALIGEGSKSGD